MAHEIELPRWTAVQRLSSPWSGTTPSRLHTSLGSKSNTMRWCGGPRPASAALIQEVSQPRAMAIGDLLPVIIDMSRSIATVQARCAGSTYCTAAKKRQTVSSCSTPAMVTFRFELAPAGGQEEGYA
ncbi:hypothetical protein H113_03624 [Trichophyton rubrum MR1459]|uniref:Uncharacterized protein n=1 Tax=Trichophyton rubrum (strain ATCC MYA-4607 / CBS 118892) TaxID=559305 RepID=A0A080WND3_TRIRC|nr:uncharacterized protein TERG_12181 [Trichophyton rubrum CBS 118892]EZF96183.1 hypothetical protein H113_03624 [Trichophyton rubrum MR1459]EZG01714.1 hypothetical protein H106_07795 [Trichophyton rubrum CBS 735.88]KFL61720.1 hypothetical protein TERG_12181 [Trichophyton rubrum CBS 118892]